MVVGLLGVAPYSPSWATASFASRRRWKREVLRIEISNKPAQPDVEERGEVRVEDAAVVRRVGYDSVESLVLPGKLLSVSLTTLQGLPVPASSLMQ